MDKYTKYIFDLDYTLLNPDWSKEDDYFKKHIPLEQQEAFFKQKQDILYEYERSHDKYDPKMLSAFFLEKGFTVTEDVINGWLNHNGKTIEDVVVDGVIELLEHLKTKGKKIIILTNWFRITQIQRIKRAGLYDYIDEIVTGEEAMKPTLKSFELAIGDTPKTECLMVGDSVTSDKAGAENAGIDCYLVTAQGNSIKNLFNMITKGGQARVKRPELPET